MRFHSRMPAETNWLRKTLDTAGMILRHYLGPDASALVTQVKLIAAAGRKFKYSKPSPSAVLTNVEKHIANHHPLSPELIAALLHWRERLSPVPLKPGETDNSIDRLEQASPPSAEETRIVARINKLLQERNAVVDAGDFWGRRVRADLESIDNSKREAWFAICEFAASNKGAKPAARWLKASAPVIDPVGKEAFAKQLQTWAAYVGQPDPNANPNDAETFLDSTLLRPANAQLLRGLVWMLSGSSDESMLSAIGDLGEICFKKVPNIGPRSVLVGNACLHVLGSASTPAAVAQLARLGTKAKHASTRATVEKTLTAVSNRTGQSRQELDELSVPTLGLDATGRLEISLGSHTAVIEMLHNSTAAELTWIGSGGKAQKSVPAAVKSDHSDDLKRIRRTLKDIETALDTQSKRIERLLRDPHEWTLAQWRERYLSHPLVGSLARRLIWSFTTDSKTQQVIPHGAKLLDSSDRPLADLPDSTRVRLWHPIDSPADSVLAWRTFLESHQITQPFKQAHREIYVLTDAERRTATYSNRFAAHILRQHQFSALCQARGWQYRLMGDFDSHNTPTLNLPAHNDLRAEFWVEPPGPGEGATSETGIYLNIVTDQVRFSTANADPYAQTGGVALDTMAPTLFSEVMRDVDLFVGVCSIGNDPTWTDTGDHRTTYWQQFAFGDLSTTAQTRREVLRNLLPKLKIADKCSITDKFLRVQGHYRAYKIHFGSANILMEPNNQYLCIVPDRRIARDNAASAGPVFLPFEGDATLSVILSKAFLLADDQSIEDTSILRQIK